MFPFSSRRRRHRTATRTRTARRSSSVYQFGFFLRTQREQEHFPITTVGGAGLRDTRTTKVDVIIAVARAGIIRDLVGTLLPS